MNPALLSQLAGMNQGMQPQVNYQPTPNQPNGVMSNPAMQNALQQAMMVNLLPQDSGSRAVNSALPFLQLLAKGKKPGGMGPLSGGIGDGDFDDAGNTMVT